MTITARLHSHAWAEDLRQFIPFYSRAVVLERNKHGNLNVVFISWPYDQNRMHKWSHRHKLTFDKNGNCLSFTEPKDGWACPQ